MLKIIKTADRGFEEQVEAIMNRSTFTDQERLAVVAEILKEVRERGDEAVLDYTAKFDQVQFKAAEQAVTTEEIEAAYEQVEDEVISSLKKAKENVKDFHQRQLRESWLQVKEEGITLGQLINPLEKVGLYVPGGRAAYPSSVLMTGVPAQVAGVEEIVMVAPPDSQGQLNPATLVAADIVGIKQIYKVGGAQAIAALALGTEVIPKVDKIVGPGNIYVTLAKKLVYGEVDIDMLAGPSEILVLADETATPSYVAADLLSQAEHDPLAASVLVTTSVELAKGVQEEVEKQLSYLDREETARESLHNYGAIILSEDLTEALEITNRFAAEHLELAVESPFEILAEIKNAGAIFLGHHTPEPVGDYFAGPNHVLPTGGSARFYSPLNIDDFVKKSSLIFYSESALAAAKEDIIRLAEVEGLDAHANSIRVRFDD
ncbi:histidinol dehydrogenase [Fuchsiella alkaliacetigena]|uniref:histidinol dehydrogenase n=1 Tax=Fuchsiella alkaliacetigena TaxID=957042 RepID=UPI00200B8578|nr:histidinol dehydrogenase [Fuchsiella alkaliacetigena]MCK8824241.1 histidinol dehydrogenase [Fuchsiella alkaliacetigena]